MDSCDIKRQYFLDGEVKERTMLNKVRKEENFKKYSYNKLTLSAECCGLQIKDLFFILPHMYVHSFGGHLCTEKWVKDGVRHGKRQFLHYNTNLLCK